MKNLTIILVAILTSTGAAFAQNVDYSDPNVVQANFEGMAEAMQRLSNDLQQEQRRSGSFTMEAFGAAAQEYADQQAWTAAVNACNGDTAQARVCPVWCAYQNNRLSVEARRAAGAQFARAMVNIMTTAPTEVNDLKRGLANANEQINALKTAGRDYADTVDKVMRKIAHNAAAATDPDRDEDERRKAVDWLATY